MGQTEIISVDALLQALSPEAPCGDNLEYEPSFIQLEQAAQAKPEVQYGDTIIAATPPEWKVVKASSLELFQRSHDLRIALPLTRALLNLHGIPGFASGLSLIEGLLDQHWPTLHPQLDASDNNDPLLRINTLATLIEASGILREVRDSTLINSRTYGRLSLRDIDIATGELDAPLSEAKPSLATFDTACSEVNSLELAQTLTALNAALRSTLRIEQVLTEQVGVTQALDLSALAKPLQRAHAFLSARLTQPNADASEALDSTLAMATQTESTPSNKMRSSDTISSREEVIQALDKICAYYAKNEASSPVPLLLQRAQKLVHQNFIELMENLAPDGLNQLYQVIGDKRDG
ncbi:MAG: type VI secretion system protein TssA [Pseudomonadota bacterium]